MVVHVQDAVAVLVTRNTLMGRVRDLKAGYLRMPAKTPSVPNASPAVPPMTPPLRVALLSISLVFFDLLLRVSYR